MACEDGTLHAFARATGEIRWSFTAEPFEPFVNGLTIAGGLAYVMGETSGTLYAVDIATGEERWRYAAASVHAAPAVAGGMAVVNTAEGFLIGLDAATGEERWRTTITTGGGAGDAALLDGMAYAGSETGDLSAVDAATGEIVWQVDTGDHRNASAVVADGIVYVGAGSLDGSLSAYDAETGALRWQRDEPLLTPSVANGVGYSGSSDGTVYAFDAATGEDLWQTQVGGYANPVAIAGDIIYVPSEGDQAVYALDAATGDVLWHITVDGEPTYQAAVVDGAIYVVTANGVIQAFAEPAPGIASPEATPADAGILTRRHTLDRRGPHREGEPAWSALPPTAPSGSMTWSATPFRASPRTGRVPGDRGTPALSRTRYVKLPLAVTLSVSEGSPRAVKRSGTRAHSAAGRCRGASSGSRPRSRRCRMRLR